MGCEWLNIPSCLLSVECDDVKTLTVDSTLSTHVGLVWDTTGRRTCTEMMIEHYLQSVVLLCLTFAL